MNTPKENSDNNFTFLNYNTPNHSASHRRAVKSHISSKYRNSVRQLAQPRYALPHRCLVEASPTKTEPDESLSIQRKRNKNSPTSPWKPAENIRWQQLPSPLETSFSGIRVDPFDSLPGPQTPIVRIALDHYVQVISPLQDPWLVAINLVNPMMTWMFPLIQKHEGAFHGAVALSQAYFEKRQDPTAGPSPQVAFHRQKAASLLRTELAHLRGAPEDGALMTVLALACLDVVYRADRMANRKGLALIVALKGGLDKLGFRGLVKAYLVQFDYFWMLETGAGSIFPFAKRKSNRSYPTHPFDSDTLALVVSLPPGFAAIARQSTLGLDVLRILSRMTLFLRSQVTRPSPGTEQDSAAEGQDYPDILDVCSCLHASPLTEHSLEKNICLAIILFSCDTHSQRGSTSKLTPYRGTRQELTRSLPLTRDRNTEERNCLIWVWMIALGSWKMDRDLGHGSLSLTQRFFDRFEESRSWNVVETAMRQFFWYEPLADEWQSTWRQAFDDYQAYRGTVQSHSLEWPRMGTGSYPMTGFQMKQLTRESTPTSTSSRGRLKEVAPLRTLPERSRPTSLEMERNVPDDTDTGSPKKVTLPPMMTLETYLGQIE